MGLQSAYEQLGQGFNKAAVPLCLINKNASVLNFNKQFEKTFGYSQEEVKTLEDWFQLAYPDPDYRKWVIDTCYAEINRATESNTDIKPIEYQITCKSGDIRTMFIFGSLIETNLLLTFFDVTESKRIETELFSQERKLRTLVERIPDLLVRYDLQLRITYVNPAWEKASGLSAEEVIGLPHTDIPKVPVPAVDEYINAIREVIETGISQTIEFAWINANGAELFLDYVIAPEYDDQRKITGVLAVGRDITAHKQAVESLLESEKRFSTIFHTNPAANALARLDNGQLVNINQAWQDLTGYSHSEAIGHTPLELNLWIVPAQRERLIKMLQEKEMVQDEVQIRKKSGEIIDLYTSASITELSGEKYLLTMGQDITGRKKAEAALRESEEKYRSMMESMEEAVYICSSDYHIEYMNPTMIKKIGRDATGELCYKTLHGLDERCPWCEHNKVMKGETIKTELAKEKEKEFFLVSHSPIFHTNGSVSKLSIYRDITETRKLEHRIQQAQKMEAIGNLAGGIAHDFNNILSSIIGFTELALDDASEGTLLEDSLQEVYSAGKRAKGLVKHILAFARQSDEKRSPIQPIAIVKEVIDFIRSTIPTTIEIQDDIKSESLILGNSTQVHQILMNLCTNAAYAMEDSGGTLHLSMKDVFIDKEKLSIGIKTGDYIEIMVSDTGTGIAPEIIDSIFEPYFTTKAQGEGTGMGLAMVQGIVESYGGSINVESRLGKGTTFTIWLPVTKKRSYGGDYVPEQIPMGTESILFVDDEASIAKMGIQILERLGYSVTARTSSIEALTLFQAKPNDFDMVVTDMTMPNMTGDTLAVELMKIRADIPVILCTGYSKKISDETASEIGIKAFAYKPLVKADLAKTVRKVLDEAKGSSHE